MESEPIDLYPMADLHKLIPEMVPHLPMCIMAAIALLNDRPTRGMIEIRY
jgi:hypothetical protein